jgi:formate transporter
MPDRIEAAGDAPLDSYAPAELAAAVERLGEGKARQPWLVTLALAVLGGAFIALGALLYTLVLTDGALGYGPGRWLAGFAFSLGLVMVLVGGAELFTGNSLMVMAWAERRITLGQLARNWALVYLGNLAGALGTVLLVWLAELPNGPSAGTAIALAEAKVALEPLPAFFRGLLCNVFVCMAVWLSLAARQVGGKVVAIALPVAAFVALGLEHSVANMYLIPIGQLAGLAQGGAGLDLGGFLANLLPVTAGNVVGGAGLVAGVYWLVYCRPAARR